MVNYRRLSLGTESSMLAPIKDLNQLTRILLKRAFSLGGRELLVAISNLELLFKARETLSQTNANNNLSRAM